MERWTAVNRFYLSDRDIDGQGSGSRKVLVYGRHKQLLSRATYGFGLSLSHLLFNANNATKRSNTALRPSIDCIGLLCLVMRRCVMAE